MQDIDQLPHTNNFPTFSQVPPTQPLEGPLAFVDDLIKITHPKRSIIGRQRGNLLQHINDFDALKMHRLDSQNIFYPFASRSEWELARWLSTTSLPQSEVNDFLHLDWVKCLVLSRRRAGYLLLVLQVKHSESPPSFQTAQDLRNRIEHLPTVPEWHHQEIELIGCIYKTKEPMVLYWRDGLEVIQQLFANPVFSNSIAYDPYQLVDPATGLRVYGDFMSAEYAWEYQVWCLSILNPFKLTDLNCLGPRPHTSGWNDARGYWCLRQDTIDSGDWESRDAPGPFISG